MNIKIDTNLYPFYPPEISFKHPFMKNNLDVAIMNVKYFDVETWNPTNSLEMMIIGIQKLLNKHRPIWYTISGSTEERIKQVLKTVTF